ncbi:hypothetical protein C2G38_2167970 [Gigaspora rosea]|uniref:Uncharacterized protein n=1 Tax=Gigaspora rosea TaxID=44941 RepID=A0A397VQ86_9GLOM|nr:hypothetical protein C2G38_2167970 [Gigaspora rosea]
MSRKRQFNAKILSKSVMDPSLHYGVWSRVCAQNPLKSGFQCTCNTIKLNVESHPSAAIKICYQKVFGTKTEYSGQAVMGFENEIIIQQPIDDVEFFSIFLQIENFNVIISNIGDLDENKFYGVSTGFVSSFTARYRGAQHLFFMLKIEENQCELEIYLESECTNQIIGQTLDDVWKEVGIHKKHTGLYIFGVTDELVREHIEMLKNKSPKCTPNDWVNFQQLEKWYQQKSSIIQFPLILERVYPPEYNFQEKELRAWQSMFVACGCTDVTPVPKKESLIEFWSKAPDPTADKELLETLYNNDIIQLNKAPQNLQPKPSLEVLTFWDSFQVALFSNKKGSAGKIRILSIIAQKFTYSPLRNKLGISNDSINSARKHARLYGLGAPLLQKPKRIASRLNNIQENQFLLFFQDRENVVMSSYHTDSKGLPILYLHDQKSEMWKKFNETYPNDFIYRSVLSNDFCLQIEESKEKLLYYLSHQTRKVYLNAQVKATLAELNFDSALFIADYKMRILPQSARETKREFFGKRAFEVVFEAMEKRPKWIKVISDNGPYYHNSELMSIVRYWHEWYGIEVRGWLFLEPGEAKTAVDSHHTAIKHAITQYLRIGHDLATGDDISQAVKNLSGTTVANIEPDRDDNDDEDNDDKKVKKSKIKVKTIKGISKLFYWKWPVGGRYNRYISTRPLPNIGEWNNFSPAYLNKLWNVPLHRPNPTKSEHTIPSSTWTIPINNVNDYEEVQKRLKIKDNINADQGDKSESQNEIINIDVEFPLTKGWTLKGNQKLGNRGGGSRIKKNIKSMLECFFLNGNRKSQDRMDAQTMHDELLKYVEVGDIETEDIPKTSTIQNWLSTYARAFKQRATIESQL